MAAQTSATRRDLADPRQTPHPTWRHDRTRRVLVAGIGAGALLVAVSWYRHTPATLPRASDVALAVGRLAGLLTGYLVLVLLVLMARVPALERSAGSDELSRLHARVGRAALLLLALHVVGVVWGYSGATGVALGGEIVVLLRDYPYVLLAAVGAGLLVLVAVTSVRAARQRLGYQAWYSVHLLTYVAVGLAFTHQIATGSDFVHDRASRLAWVAASAAAAAVVLYARVLRPAVLAVRHPARVAAVAAEPGGAISLSVQVSPDRIRTAEAGQFFRLRLLAGWGWLESHPYSLSAAPGAGQLRFTVRPSGRYARLMAQVRVGDAVVLTGPYGTLTARRRSRPSVLLVAGGIGITPLRALLESLPETDADPVLIYRASTAEGVLFRDELDALLQRRGGRAVYLVGRRDSTDDPLGPDQLCQTVPDVADRDVYLCAPAGMTAHVRNSLRALGVPPGRVHAESFELADEAVPAGQRVLVAVASVAAVAGVLVVRVATGTPPARFGVATPPAPGRVPGAASTSADGTVTVLGPVERTLFSDVEVEVIARHGRVVDVRAVLLPDVDEHTRQLSALAAPILRREAIAAGAASIDAVTGATYTSGAYMASLQGALDQLRATRSAPTTPG